jgi:UrcA family protein
MNRLVAKSTLAATALAVSLGTVTAARAGQLDETVIHEKSAVSATVTFSRADLATADGRELLERRIRRAAEKVCGPLSYRDAGSLGILAERRECYNRAVDQAMSEVAAGQLASTAS